jgi:proteasome lid subunit RPN8/RPN11
MKECCNQKLLELPEVIRIAKQTCGYSGEEEGGFILRNKTDQESFDFVKIKNSNTGHPIAAVLYNADRQEVGEKVIRRTLNGWQVFASFHTHPGTSTVPSTIDLKNLFTTFKINYIYSPKADELAQYTIRPIESLVYEKTVTLSPVFEDGNWSHDNVWFRLISKL